MKHLVKIFALVLFILGFANVSFAQRGQSGQCMAITLPKQDLSQAEKQILLQMRQEEKLAHDVYFTLYSKWNVPIFNNIAKSEEVHTQRWKEMLQKYDISDPVKDTEIGKFADQKFTDLYNKLVAQGSKSLKDAYIVGATIEDMDINDINQALTKTDNDDIKMILNNTRQGSYHHLRAFTRMLKRSFDYQYEPQYISKEDFQKIISAPMGKHHRGMKHGKMQHGGMR